MTYQGTALAQQQPAPRVEWHELPEDVRQHTEPRLYRGAQVDADTIVVDRDAAYGDDERLTYRRESGRWVLRSVNTTRNMGR